MLGNQVKKDVEVEKNAIMEKLGNKLAERKSFKVQGDEEMKHYM